MKNITKILLLFLALTAFSCKDNSVDDTAQEYSIECGEMNVAILSSNKDKISEILTAFFNTRAPKVTSGDPYGYQLHFNTLLNQLQGCSNLAASPTSCYACTSTSSTSTIYVKASNSATTTRLTIQLGLVLGKFTVQSITNTP